MIPLHLSWAITIHKSQGLTLDEIIVNLGRKENTPGQTFVAISRVRSLESLILKDLTKERIKGLMEKTRKEEKSFSLKQNLEEIERLRRLT